MRKTSLSCLAGLAALACSIPAVAQPNDPLTRFLDGVFKPGAGRTGAPVEQPRPAAPTPQVAPQAPARVQSSPNPTASAPTKPKPQRAETSKAPAKPVTAEKPKPAPAPAEKPIVAEQPTVAERPKPEPAVPVKPAVVETPNAEVVPVRAPAAPAAPVAQAVPSSPAAALDRVNAYFNSIDQLTASFVQTSTNGPRAEGTLAIKRPGQLHFAYAPPSTLEVISDGRSVAVRDKKLGTNDVYSIRQTPLKFLVQEQVDLAKDTKIRDVQVGPDGMVTVQFEDSATLGGTSKITLRFDARANALKQWTVLDAQGYQTTVVLSDVNMVRRISASAGN
jgi:outer membrane lipoprotein-sorting protein